MRFLRGVLLRRDYNKIILHRYVTTANSLQDLDTETIRSEIYFFNSPVPSNMMLFRLIGYFILYCRFALTKRHSYQLHKNKRKTSYEMHVICKWENISVLIFKMFQVELEWVFIYYFFRKRLCEVVGNDVLSFHFRSFSIRPWVVQQKVANVAY